VIQALVFDFDGLILDTETPEAGIWQDLYTRHGQEFSLDDWVRSVVGATVDNLDPVVQLERLTGQPMDSIAIYEHANRTRQSWLELLPPLPGVADILDSARQLGLRLAVASSSPHSWVDGFLRHLKFFDLFEAVICREQVLHLKPAPDLFLAALEALHTPAGQAIAFEDSPNGVRAAQAAGMRVVGVANPITAHLGPLPANLNLGSLADLPLPGLLAHFGDWLDLRLERLEDLPGIRRVEEAAFDRPAEADLVDLARRRGKSTLSMVAESDGDILAHVLFTPVRFDPAQPGRRGLGLGPIAVRPDMQRKGIGSRLMRAGLEAARRTGAGFVVLLGDPGYYARFGFKPSRAFGLTSDYGDGYEFQVLPLRSDLLEGSGGRIRYIPEFEEAGC
jgi:HAD superfamily hydrolase (TIGR01509 family)